MRVIKYTSIDDFQVGIIKMEEDGRTLHSWRMVVMEGPYRLVIVAVFE
jgi:hypothetical protein